MLQQQGVCHFEEPCPYWELEQTAEVAAALELPVAGGEQDTDLAQFRRMIALARWTSSSRMCATWGA